MACSRCGLTGHNITTCKEIEDVNRASWLSRKGVLPRGHLAVSLGPDEEPPEGAKFIGYEIPFQHCGRSTGSHSPLIGWFEDS